jgi:hypothetical protein
MLAKGHGRKTRETATGPGDAVRGAHINTPGEVDIDRAAGPAQEIGQRAHELNIHAALLKPAQTFVEGTESPIGLRIDRGAICAALATRQSERASAHELIQQLFTHHMGMHVDDHGTTVGVSVMFSGDQE